jgi:hypothetical protein
MSSRQVIAAKNRTPRIFKSTAILESYKTSALDLFAIKTVALAYNVQKAFVLL